MRTDLLTVRDKITIGAHEFCVIDIEREIENLISIDRDATVKDSLFTIRYKDAATAETFTPLFRYEESACVKAYWRNEEFFNAHETDENEFYEEHYIDLRYLASRVSGEDRHDGPDLLILYEITSAD